MSDETLRLLTSSDALDGYLAGLIGLALLGSWASLRRRPVSGGGLFVVAAALLALEWTHRVPAELIVGLLLLSLATMAPTESLIGAMVLAIPGATALGAAFVSSPRAELVVYVVVAVAVLAPIVARFDASDHEAASGLSLLSISMVGVFLTVPDTDLVVVVAAAAAPFALMGFPLRLARLGRAGAQAGTGLLIWAVAVGGEARSAALIAGTAALGVLIVAPLMREVRRISTLAPLPAVMIQGVLCVLLALVAGLSASVVAAATAILLVLVAVVSVALQRSSG